MRNLLASAAVLAASVALFPALPAAADETEGEKIQAGDSCIYYAVVDDEEDTLKYHVYNECGKPVKVTVEVRPADKSDESADCDETVVVDLTEVQDAYVEVDCPDGSNYLPNVFYEE
jgi:hypothetical protein